MEYQKDHYFAKFRRERNEEEALLVAGQMQKTKILHLTPEISLSAAELSLKYQLPMADCIVYASARQEGCQVATSDPHFEGLDGVLYIH